MVFHQIERALGSSSYLTSRVTVRTQHELQALGFSAEEAEQLAWIED
jgi:hypothetical protein